MMNARGQGGRWAKRVGAVVAVVVAVSLGGGAAAQTEAWRAIAIGESNDAAQQAELLGYFEVGAGDRLSTVTVGETLAAMAGIYDLEGVDTAYSSTALTCLNAGSGLEVSTRNIEVVSPELYALALVTAGIEDARLMVAAPDDAPALGMTALTGVFATLDGAPCGPQAAGPERQRLALEGLTLAAELRQARGGEVERGAAARVVLETQRAVVAGDVTERAAIEGIVAEEEGASAIELSADERERLVDLMTRLGGAGLDWGGFDGGWTTDWDPAASRVAVVGARAAVTIGVGGASQDETTPATSAPATATPTGEATDAATATARTLRQASPAGGLPAASPLATPASTAIVAPRAAATATSEPATATPDPTETAVAAGGTDGRTGPPDATLAGTVVERRDGGGVLVEQPNGERRAFAAAAGGVVVTRAGTVARMADVEPGDRIELTVDGASGEMVRVDATPTANEGPSWLERFGWIAAPLLIALAAVLFARKRIGRALGSRGATIVKPARGLVAKPTRTFMTRRRSWIFGRRNRGAAGD